jgi:hypothetical protein
VRILWLIVMRGSKKIREWLSHVEMVCMLS